MKKVALILTLVLIICLSVLLVSCDTNKDNSKIVCDKDNDYIKIWYDEAWFPGSVHIDCYHDNQFLRMYNYVYNGGYLYCEQLTNHDGSWSVVPNTWMYIKNIDRELRGYDYITLKVCKGSSHYINNDDDCEVLAEYTISIK